VATGSDRGDDRDVVEHLFSQRVIADYAAEDIALADARRLIEHARQFLRAHGVTDS
jgi:hypothetical protein